MTGNPVDWVAPATAGVCTITVIASDASDADTFDKEITVQSTQVFGEDTVAYTIPDGDSVFSTITISGAPAGVVLDSITVATSITHNTLTDLRIMLRAEDADETDLWPSGTYPTADTTVTTTYAGFVGDSPNGTWTLGVYDELSPEAGTLNSWSITIYW